MVVPTLGHLACPSLSPTPESTMISSRKLRTYDGWRAAITLALLITMPILSVHAGAMNRTIDDYKGDEVTGLRPIYQPEDTWWYGPECKICMVKPDVGKVRGGSWHDRSAGGNTVSNITLKFTGTSMCGAV
jgi:hypothetical protein